MMLDNKKHQKYPLIVRTTEDDQGLFLLLFGGDGRAPAPDKTRGRPSEAAPETHHLVNTFLWYPRCPQRGHFMLRLRPMCGASTTARMVGIYRAPQWGHS